MGRRVTTLLGVAGVILMLSSFTFAQGPPSGVGPPPHAGPGPGKTMKNPDRQRSDPGERSGERYQRIKRSREDLRRKEHDRPLRSPDRRFPPGRSWRRAVKPDVRGHAGSPRVHPGKGRRGNGPPAHARRHIPPFAPVPGSGWQPEGRRTAPRSQRRDGQLLDRRTQRRTQPHDPYRNPEDGRFAQNEHEVRQQPEQVRKERQLTGDEQDRSDERPEQERD